MGLGAFSLDNVTGEQSPARSSRSVMVGAFCRGPRGAGQVQGPARGGAIARGGGADRARDHGLVVAPAVAVAGGGCRYIRYITRACSGCSGGRLSVRYMPVAGLTCGFGCL